MDPLASDPSIHGNHLQFSLEGNNLQTCDCYTQHQRTEPCAQPKLDHTTAGKDDLWSLSDKPYFHFIIAKYHVKHTYQLVLPTKVQQMLPQAEVPVILTCRNKNWKMMYYGDRSLKRFDTRWRNFFIDNNLKIGDGCVFELSECSNESIKFRVRILNGEIPHEFQGRVDGVSPNTPILID